MSVNCTMYCSYVCLMKTANHVLSCRHVVCFVLLLGYKRNGDWATLGYFSRVFGVMTTLYSSTRARHNLAIFFHTSELVLEKHI